MTHTWKFLCFAALGAALVVCPNLRAGDTGDKPQPTNADLKAALDRISERLGSLDEKVGTLEVLSAKVKSMEKDLKTLKDHRPLADNRLEGIEDQLRLLGDRLDQMERRLERMPAGTRQSNFQPAPALPGNTPSGTILLQNSWTDVATVVLNGRAYQVPPGQTLSLPNQPAGAYTYEVIANGYGTIRGPVMRNLENNGTLSVYVYPAR
jgi:hypothetical protein